MINIPTLNDDFAQAQLSGIEKALLILVISKLLKAEFLTHTILIQEIL